MPQPTNPEHAKFQVVEFLKTAGGQDVKEVGDAIPVQFNPETLTVTYTNQKSGGDQKGGGSMQYVGQGTTKLSLDLWFDVTVASDPSMDDVRKETAKINDLIKPSKDSKDPKKFISKCVRFTWGTFQFTGFMDSLTEKLELFSESGKPLRAQLTVSLSSQEIQFQTASPSGTGSGGASAQSPFSGAQSSGSQGSGSQASAASGTGSIFGSASFNAQAGFGASASAQGGLGFGIGASAGASADASAGASAGVGFGASAEASASAGGFFGASAGTSGTAGAAFSASAGLSGGLSGGTTAQISAGGSAGFSEKMEYTFP